MLRLQARLPFLTLAHELGALGNYLPLGIFCFFIFRKFVLDELVLYSLLLGKNDIILCIL